ncbi:cellulose binding domain-containing protein [Cellulomonas sp. PhB143]|uniref:cellulose binding domain-containing protein n=1 Tax=Cellulomonas sp. PhB143 TaxID=2485186 RepID=UPI000F462B9A|nr:cellulose binding domain-containing protein [Cellulomonas sp. PhB143]ROS78612.1 carbohydrate-binding protein with CBM35 doain [Cellulomonas sp. PhB143]
MRPTIRRTACLAAALTLGAGGAAVPAAAVPAAAVPAAAVPGDTPGLPVALEAEDAALAGGAGVNADHLGYSGSGFVDGFVIDNTGTASITFDLDVPVAGEYGLNVRYANGLGSTMTLSQVAGGEDRQIELPSDVGAGWSFWFVHQEVVDLDAGEQQVTYRFDDDDTGNVNIDAVALTTVGDLTTPGGGQTDPGDQQGTGPDTRWDGVTNILRSTHARQGQTYEAEDAFHANGAVVTEDGVDLSAERARAVVAVDATKSGTQTATVRYRNDGADASLVLGADGAALGRLALPATRGWAEVGVPVTLRAGVGSVELRATGTAHDGALVLDRVVLQRGTAFAETGATVPYIEHEAEQGLTNGEILAPSRAFHDVAAEASGRQAVRLADAGDHVEWRLTEPTSSLVLRASIPDTADGAGQIGSLGVYAGKKKVADVPVSSEHSWVYGGYPYDNDPSGGSPQRYFDESRVRFPTLPAGTTLRLQKDKASADLDYTVDLVDTELVPRALAAPDGFLDVTGFGATPDDGTDDTAAVQAAVDAATEAGTGVWVPEGRFTLSARVRVHAVTVRGAGPWYSVLEGTDGKGGIYAQGSGVTVADLMIDGDVDHRDDGHTDAALEGSFGAGSLVQDVWVEHTKVGLWADAGTDGLYALGLRVRDTYADGVHLHGSVSDSRVEHSVVRNTGDDAMAMWSAGGAVTRSVFAHDTVQVPLLGNGLAIYGGDSNAVTDNAVSDTLTAAAGVAVSTRFNPVPFSGTTVVDGNTLVRTGGWEPNWSTSFGAVWVFADTSHITTPVVLSDNRILDSTYEGILVSGSKWVNELTVRDTTITDTGSYGLAFRVGGNHHLKNVVVSGNPTMDDGNRFHFWGTMIDDGGNLGVTQPLPSTCTVRATASGVWHGGYVATVTLKNTGTTPVDGWDLRWHLGSGQSAGRAWGAASVQDGPLVTASDLGWNRVVAPGRSVTFGYVGTTNGSRVDVPDAFTLNGIPCARS